MSIPKQSGVKELSDINLRELANEVNDVLTKHVGGRLWTEVVGFTKLPRSGGGGLHLDEWSITLKVEDMEILGRSDRPDLFEDSLLRERRGASSSAT